MTFDTEQMLVDQLLLLLETDATCWGPVRTTSEFFYSRGRTDVLALGDGDTLIAFEAKLTDWKTALQQAYRNTCFANSSYVVLPLSTALMARQYLGEFQKRGVGLCYVDGENVIVLHESPLNQPLEPWLASEAITAVAEDQNRDFGSTCPISN